MKAHHLFVFLAISFFTCKDSKKETIKVDEISLEEGFKILNTSCFSCHNPNPKNKTKVAPSPQEIKLAYLNKYTDFDNFLEHFVAFQENPLKANAIMPEAIDKYGIMPKLGYTKEQLTAVAGYIYTSNLETNDWFAVSYPKEREKYLKTNTENNPLEIGKNIALQTKSILGKNLLNAIKTKGTEGAVSFCSTRAIPLTDSMAVVLNARIKRVSDKNRNPSNAANEQELKYIKEIQELLRDGNETKPQMIETENTITCYYPIITNDMCLQCHGKMGSTMTQQTYTKIKSVYAEDKAIGYSENELRGIWVVEMDK
ncbi:MAG TPA: DUF3365 domain-containing protein [Mangrovimonas sp.]|nr:DUF3365 domain-containing protein [Mangrovimonas sp.]